ncbi:MAG: methylated-DNA-[protein]-cysteine S-methyltransferase [Methylobacteriaceae bacterium]|jgi:methylated-DNA-[protein]-cysteine S-methyltransferase|nr:methylated-DNA-[protein]-cysteine S-methyltransferase [Methylobacteriaceae bacterium]
MNFALDRLPTPIGLLLVVFDEEDRLRALDWDDYEERMRRLLRLQYGSEIGLREGSARSLIRESLNRYFAGDFSALDRIEVETGGTPFQRKLWTALRTIPSGQTSSYGALAAKIGVPKAIRAVGAANGANPISIVLPCHRVIGSNQRLTGYGGGLHRKHWLLTHEGAAFRG